jgi:metal-responsive CopG/Arc/MetJ family transcriptional regulator
MAEDEWASVDAIAKEEGRSRSDVIRRLAAEAIRSRQEKKGSTPNA